MDRLCGSIVFSNVICSLSCAITSICSLRCIFFIHMCVSQIEWKPSFFFFGLSHTTVHLPHKSIFLTYYTNKKEGKRYLIGILFALSKLLSCIFLKKGKGLTSSPNEYKTIQLYDSFNQSITASIELGN